MNTFRLDRGNAKLMGVCAGFANATGLDRTLVRVAVILLALFFFPLTVIGYLLTAWAAS